MNPKPPETLNKETRGVWNGWRNMGDEKVAHEAAIKGLHISLAIEFLALRQQIGIDEAKIWFEEEVMTIFINFVENSALIANFMVINL